MTNRTDTRIHTLDFVRGLALISMILFHTAWDLSFMYEIKILQSMGVYAQIWQQSICITFILLSGFCFSLGKNSLKRGIIVFGSGFLVTGVTFIFIRQNVIIFGILTLIGSAMIICALLNKLLSKLNAAFGLVLSFILFILTKDISNGYLGFYGIRLLSLPSVLYKNLFTAYLGFPNSTFYSTDYFPLLPWLFLFLTGYFLYALLKQKNVTVPKGKNIPLINFIGKNSLIIYLLHQPVIYGILSVIFSK